MIRQPENFPAQVKEVRRQLGLSQEELAHALGVSFATVNRWENGKTTPSKLALKQFAVFCSSNTRSGKLKLEDKDVTP
jgi:DNA-binding transcriptional regulator YiaG